MKRLVRTLSFLALAGCLALASLLAGAMATQAQVIPFALPMRLVTIGDAAGAHPLTLQGPRRLDLPHLPIATPQDIAGNRSDVHLRLFATVRPGRDGRPLLAVGEEEYSLIEFGRRLAATFRSVERARLRLAYLHLDDPEGALSREITAFQRALSSVGFDMILSEVGRVTSGCRPELPVDEALFAGLADRVPHGNGNGVTEAEEAERYLIAALARPGQRKPGCVSPYGLIIRRSNDPEMPVARAAGVSLPVPVEEAFARETEAVKLLLTSPDIEKVEEFLATCLHCPRERELIAHREALREKEAERHLETMIWNEIRDDETPERLKVYLSSCKLCLYREAAKAAVELILAKADARESEAKIFAYALENRNITLLRSYVSDCIACDDKRRAEEIVTAYDAELAYRAEMAVLEEAVARRDRTALEAWLQNCSNCIARARAEAALEDIRQGGETAAPCIRAAGLPQMGGPRELIEIDPARARNACLLAIAQLPNDPLLKLFLARVEHAEGWEAMALAYYDTAAAEGLSTARGLAAHTRLHPLGHGVPDLPEILRLAEAGAAQGDWLSREVLMEVHAGFMAESHVALHMARGLAAEGDAMASFFLARQLLAASRNTPGHDDGEAFDLLLEAVAGGIVAAQPHLARLYEEGRGVAPNPKEAADLLWSALEEGDASALDWLTDGLSARPREVVRLIQERLIEIGLFFSPADGQPSPETADAVRAHATRLRQPS